VKNLSRPLNPWCWISSLYLAEGMPYFVVMTLAGIMFKNLGISNTQIALYTSWLYLPWVLKFLWSPFIDLFKTKRWWIVIMQSLMAIGLGGIALTLPGNHFFRYSLLFFWLLAFSSATHDIAADGFYMLGLSKKQQAYFIGIRNTFYRLASVAVQGGIVMLAGKLEEQLPVPIAWTWTMSILTVIFIVFSLYHSVVLPHPNDDQLITSASSLWKKFISTFICFFQKTHIGKAIAFLLLFRLAESQLAKIASLFLLDNPDKGGLGLSTTDVGVIYGTIGVIALIMGGIAGGILIARNGLHYWLWPMTIAMNIPNLIYVYLAFCQPASYFIISAGVALEQFGYGFGFTAYTFYMILFSNGPHRTAHYAICTGFMALGMMIPGMISGWIEEISSYRFFFIWVMLCTIPSFCIVHAIRSSIPSLKN